MTNETIEAEVIPSEPVVKGKFVVVRRYFHKKGYFAKAGDPLPRYYIFQGMASTLMAAGMLIEKRMKDGSKQEDYRIFRLLIPKDW